MARPAQTPEKGKNTKSKAEKGGKKGKPKGKDALKEQVLALGGDKEDLALLNGVKDVEMVQGEQTADVRFLF